MEDIEAIKKKRLQELQAQQKTGFEEQLQQEAEEQQQLAALESLVKQKLTKEAVERYGNLKAAHPEKAMQLLILLAQAIQTSNIDKIDDYQLKELLTRMQPKKKKFKITIK